VAVSYPHDNNVGLLMLSLPKKIHNIYLPYHQIIHYSQCRTHPQTSAVILNGADANVALDPFTYRTTTFKIDTHRLYGKIVLW
jgi:hypothetical protein